YVSDAIFTSPDANDPCCSYPCQHQSVCTTSDMISFQCDCTATGYYGVQCQLPYLSTRIKSWVKPAKSTSHYLLTHFKPLWWIVNNVTWLRRSMMQFVLKLRVGFVTEPSPYRGMGSYPSWQAYANDSMYVRTLPPVPLNCPTPMGVKGKPKLPDVDVLVEKFFKRKKFQPCPQRTSLLFPFFAQHFTHMFFKTDPVKGFPHQWGKQSVDLSNIYGQTLDREHELRSHIGGKMKTCFINGEEFPPRVNESDATMAKVDSVPKDYQFVHGHQGFGMMPTFLVWTTIWIREHNRVCDLIKNENPAWDDERIYQSARLVITGEKILYTHLNHIYYFQLVYTGELIKIVIEDYVQHLSGFHYKLLYEPELVQEGHFSFHNQINAEFQLLYHWHPLMPDDVKFNNKTYLMKDLLFNPVPVVKSGMAQVIQDLSQQWAGKVAGGSTQGLSTLEVARLAIKDGRTMRMQSLNAYRERFGLKRLKSFEELTGEKQMASELKELYGDIDAMEYYVGIMLEKRRIPQLFGETLTEMGSPYSLKGLFANPINHPAWWKPSTFGGQKVMDVIKGTTLQNLICRTVEGCPRASFTVPSGAI
uniref:prostaglandin-endoperoxide synthase n=1 Tax=Ciona savignyi TaxID=51511 RepID=H2ZG05_CIOSA